MTWDGYDSRKRNSSKRLKLIARQFVRAENYSDPGAEDHFLALWLSVAHERPTPWLHRDILGAEREAWDERGRATKTTVPKPDPQCTVCDGNGSYTQEGCFTGGLNEDGSGCGWYEQLPCDCPCQATPDPPTVAYDPFALDAPAVPPTTQTCVTVGTKTSPVHL